jgi:hypothetical protein
VYFFAGYKKSDEFPEIIHLEGCLEDVQSATTKQFRGLKWMVQNCPAQSYMMFGSDTYPNIPNLLVMLDKYDLKTDLYIGGHGESRHGGYRQVGTENVYFHSGGAGFILTRPAAEKIARFTEEILFAWPHICLIGGVNYLAPACDVNIAYFCARLDIGPAFEKYFYGCNYQGIEIGGRPCCPVVTDKICSCHHMTPKHMRDYYALLTSDK